MTEGTLSDTSFLGLSACLSLRSLVALPLGCSVSYRLIWVQTHWDLVSLLKNSPAHHLTWQKNEEAGKVSQVWKYYMAKLAWSWEPGDMRCSGWAHHSFSVQKCTFLVTRGSSSYCLQGEPGCSAFLKVWLSSYSDKGWLYHFRARVPQEHHFFPPSLPCRSSNCLNWSCLSSGSWGAGS